MVSARAFLLSLLLCLSTTHSVRIKKHGKRDQPPQGADGQAVAESKLPTPDAAPLPTDCASVTSEDRFSYTFGPEMMQLGGTTLQAWGGKSDSDKGEDRELHVCLGDRCVFAILDGHGTRTGEGAIISQKAKEVICARLPRMADEASVKEELAGVVEEINKLSVAYRAGSTMTGFVVQEESIVAFNIGDSPIVWTGENLRDGIIGESENHDCHNNAEMDRIREHKKKDKSWDPCEEDQGRRMKEGRTMATRGLGDKGSLRYGFLQVPEVITLPVPKSGEDGPHWFMLSSDGILSDTSDMFKMQLTLSRTELVKYLAQGFAENGTDIGVRDRIDELFTIGLP